MITPYWKHRASADNDYVRLAQQRHVDIQRLWKRLPPSPTQYTGRPSPQLSAELYSRVLFVNILGSTQTHDWLLTAPARTYADGSTQHVGQIDVMPADAEYERDTEIDLRVYGLIFWDTPLADPDWLAFIQTGYWRGRLVLAVPDQNENAGLHNASVAYVNTLTAFTGLALTVPTDCNISNGNTGTMNGASPFSAGCAGNISWVCPDKVTGGTWISKTSPSNGIWAAENSPALPNGHTSFVLMGGVDWLELGVNSLNVAADKPFVQNLWSVTV